MSERRTQTEIGSARYDAFVFYSLGTISFLESTVATYVDNLEPFYREDPETLGWLRAVWLPEESAHGRWTRGFVARTWPEFDWAGGYQRFARVFGPRCAHDLLRPSPALEALARCVTETETAMMYRCLAEYTRDVELRGLLRRMSSDEVRHYGYFRRVFERHDRRERNSTWRKARTLVARSQLVRDEDVKLSFQPLNACWRTPPPFVPLDFDSFLSRATEVMAAHFPIEQALRMLFRPLRDGRWFERRLVWLLSKILLRQFRLAA